MNKKILTLSVTFILSVILLFPAAVSAQPPEIMRSLKSYIETYGALKGYSRNGSYTYSSLETS